MLLFRQMRFPVGVDLLALRIEMSCGRELLVAHAWSRVHGGYGGVQHQQVEMGAGLEVSQGTGTYFSPIPKIPPRATTR